MNNLKPTAGQGGLASLGALPVVSAAVGVLAAVLLGGGGFVLGCLYAEWSGPPITVASAAPASAAAATEIRSGLGAASLPAMGGPVVPAPGPALPPAGQSGGAALGMAHPVASGWLSSGFGPRADPFTGEPAVHRGLDYAGLDNSAVLAVAPGVVSWSGRQRGYGNLIEIDHGRGWITRYGHNALNLVQVGDYVKPGQTIGLMGATGRATSTHLHFEVLYRGRHQDPSRLLPRET